MDLEAIWFGQPVAVIGSLPHSTPSALGALIIAEVLRRSLETAGSSPVVVEVETPDSEELVEALAGEFVASLAVLACKVIAEEQEPPFEMSEHHRYYEDDQQPRLARMRA